MNNRPWIREKRNPKIPITSHVFNYVKPSGYLRPLFRCSLLYQYTAANKGFFESNITGNIFDFSTVISVSYIVMIDFHTHTLFSDGVLLPSEIMRRAHMAGYKALAFTDHVDASNIDFVVPRTVEFIRDIVELSPIKLIAGVEITHVPPGLIGRMVERARALGAKLVVVHGETAAEPVAEGTNSAGIAAGADILSHPGLITKEDALKAHDKGVALEITSRKGHSITNGHVYRMAVETGATVILSSDAHGPEDLISPLRARVVLRGAGVPEEMVDTVLANSQKLLDRVI